MHTALRFFIYEPALDGLSQRCLRILYILVDENFRCTQWRSLASFAQSRRQWSTLREQLDKNR